MDGFAEAASAFILLRLAPGPAEWRFGITAAPMFAVADWHGRVVDDSLRIPGDLAGAREALRAALARFDREKAGRPPFEPPAWATQLLSAEGGAAMQRLLDSIHPVSGEPKGKALAFEELARLWRFLEREVEIMAFAASFMEACRKRAPRGLATYAGHSAEADLLAELTFCRNDKIKFGALETFGRCAPLERIGFFQERARRAWEGARNGNVVLCSCLKGLGLMAARLEGPPPPPIEKRLLTALDFPTEVLKTQERNNSACLLSARSIEAILEATGSPRALEAYFHCLKPSDSDKAFIQAMTKRFREQAAARLASWTGAELGIEQAAWMRWYREGGRELVYDRDRRRFLPVR